MKLRSVVAGSGSLIQTYKGSSIEYPATSEIRDGALCVQHSGECTISQVDIVTSIEAILDTNTSYIIGSYS